MLSPGHKTNPGSYKYPSRYLSPHLGHKSVPRAQSYSVPTAAGGVLAPPLPPTGIWCRTALSLQSHVDGGTGSGGSELPPKICGHGASSPSGRWEWGEEPARMQQSLWEVPP